MSTAANWDAKQYPTNINPLEDEFHEKMRASSIHVQMYEDPFLQQTARSVMPVDLLRARARERLAYSSTPPPSSLSSRSFDIMDCLLMELLAWFKHDFFSWFNVPNCSMCAVPMANVGHVQPNADEIRWGGNRVEQYRCVNKSCETSTSTSTSAVSRFPRYNHPEKLLQTRTGRCGEWANCFTLLCVSLGFEARYVLDWTDHVWTEVHSASQGRWLHCDPCENLCDSPLVYESGWNKKLTYVLAFSKDDIQDVTWRYSSRHTEVLSRRLLCRETWLVRTILSMRSQLQANARPARKVELDRRLLVELIEFMLPKRAPTKDAELEGRMSGSLDWRRSRGEIGSKDNSPTSTVFELSDDEARSKEFHLKYCSATDTYLRGSSMLQGWQKGLHHAANLFRKVETDWRQVYLARIEGCNIGQASWKVAVGENRHNLTVKTVALRCDSAVYENGSVIWKICAGNKCVQVKNDLVPFITNEFSGEREVTIEAELSGGRGSVGWQHAQLFRLSLNDTDKYPFDVSITFADE